MLERAAKKMGQEIANNLSAKMKEMSNVQNEWHVFSCSATHTFAFQIPVDIPISKVMEYYNALQCPACGSKLLKKQTNL